MNRRHFMAGMAALPIAAQTATANASFTALAKDAEGATSATTVKLAEPMMHRYRLTLNRVLHGGGPSYTPDFLLEDIHATPGRRFTEFSGDVSGRWIGAMSSASSVYGQDFPVLDEVVHRTIALQHPEGYFGSTFHFDNPTDNDLALLWGNGRLLVGLMEYYALKHNPDVLASARKLGDFLVRIGPEYNSKKMADQFGAAHFASSYICWTQQTEGLAALYAATKENRYLDLCAAISHRMERRSSDHVHGYLCSLRGTLDLYTATGDKAHLQRVQAAWQGIMHSGDVLITGGVPEAWSPKRKRTEGCAECDWLRLNLALWRSTGDTMYLDAAEQTLFNEFSMNQFSTGDFGHAALDENGVPITVYVRAWWCCTLHGLRTFPDIHRSVFRTSDGETFYDLPIDGHIHATDISARATSRLATDATIRIQIEHASASQKLTLRKPSWAHDVKVSRNGRPIEGLTIASLKAGDHISAKYEMSLNAKPMENSKHNVFSYGPWLLGASSEVNPGYFNELHPRNTLLLASARSSTQHASSPFSVPLAATAIEYLPAEFPKQPARVNLRAVAEQTAIRPTQWQLTFALNDHA